MIAVRAKYDGKQIVFPDDFRPPGATDVIVVFDEPECSDEEERQFWMRASEEAFRKVWDNPEDAIYDNL